VFSVIFEANLRRIPGGNMQPINDLRTLRDFLYAPVVLAVMEAPVSLVALLLTFAISPVLGWTSVAAAVVQTFVGWRNERSTQPPLLAANRSASGAQQYADGSLRNAQVIESMGMLPQIYRRWIERQREFLGLQAQASDNAGFYQAVSKFVQNTVSSMLLGLGAWLLLRNQLNGGAAYMIIGSILGGRVLAPLVQLVAQWQAVVNAREAYARLDGMLGAVPPRPPSMVLPKPKGHLQVEGVVAAAPGSQLAILKGVGFALSPGEAMAVWGLPRLAKRPWPACWWVCGRPSMARFDSMGPMFTPGTSASLGPTWATCRRALSCLMALLLRTLRVLVRSIWSRSRRRRGPLACMSSFWPSLRAMPARLAATGRCCRVASASG
jgi:ATP-binding cassette subfamily C exporter for protease/lipase